MTIFSVALLVWFWGGAIVESSRSICSLATNLHGFVETKSFERIAFREQGALSMKLRQEPRLLCRLIPLGVGPHTQVSRDSIESFGMPG